MLVLGFDPSVAVKQAQQMGVRMLSKPEILQQANLVMLYTAHLLGSSGEALHIGARELGQLRPTPYLVNCAGIRLIDEATLLAGLDQCCLARATLDVFSQEPIKDYPIVRSPLLKTMHPKMRT